MTTSCKRLNFRNHFEDVLEIIFGILRDLKTSKIMFKVGMTCWVIESLQGVKNSDVSLFFLRKLSLYNSIPCLNTLLFTKLGLVGNQMTYTKSDDVLKK